MIRKTSKLMEINIFHQINICLFHKQNLCLVETPNLNGKGSWNHQLKRYLSDECLQNEIVNETNESNLIVQEEFTREILSKVSTPNYSVDDWVLVKYDDAIFVWTIKEIADDKYHLASMHECGENQFKWPSRTDSCWYKSTICMIKGPIPKNNHGVF